MNGTATRRSRAASVNSVPLRERASDSWLHAAQTIPARVKTARDLAGLARQAAYVAIDFLLVCLGGVLVFWLRFGLANLFSRPLPVSASLLQQVWSADYPGFLILYAGLVVLACMSQDLYRTPREQKAWEESANIVRSVGFATALLVLFIFTSGNKETSRLVVAGLAVWNAGVLAGWRYAKRRYVLRRVQHGKGVSRVLIVGAGKLGQALASWLEENRQLGYQVCGFLDSHPNGNADVLGSVSDLRKVALGQFADQLFVTLPTDRELVKEIFLEARRLRLNLSVVPDIYDGLGWRAPIETIGGFPVIELHGEPIPVLGLAAKRSIDLLVATAVLLLTAPVLAFAAIWIRADSPGPVFYPAMRVGKKGRPFRCYKLRTMIEKADALKDTLRTTNERSGPFFKMENDPRVTRCGKWLRKFSLDELPQLVNVLFGDMSLVGPRPHPTDDFERYTLEHLRRLDVKPGVTGLWQVKARRDPSFDTNMLLDLEYIEHWSLRLDLNILLRTIHVVVEGQGL